MKLALGTVQFGLHYGIRNTRGQVTFEEAKSIIAHAWDHGINTLDTAIAYGDSENRLGEMGVSSWQVVSKLPAVPENCRDVREWVQAALRGSLARLKIDRLYGLLLHSPEQLLPDSGDVLFQTLTALKAEDLVHKIGISIYDPEILGALCERYRFDIIQAPFNVLDRRLASSGWLTKLYDNGIEVHARSVFLQGLMLMRPEDRPKKFSRWQATWDKWEAWLREAELTPLEACLSYALSVQEIAKVIVGVDTLDQIKEILLAANGTAPHALDGLECNDINLINPALWQNS